MGILLRYQQGERRVHKEGIRYDRSPDAERTSGNPVSRQEGSSDVRLQRRNSGAGTGAAPGSDGPEGKDDEALHRGMRGIGPPPERSRPARGREDPWGSVRKGGCMWTSFICPDEVQIKIEDCINECRMDRRCVAKPTLIMFAMGLPKWKGKISTTQALNGTRLEFLRLKHDYGEAPCDRAFALAGTQHHLKYQKIEIPGALYEEWMEDEEGTGMFDYYDSETFELYDFKLIGGYKVNRILGKFSEEVPVAGEFFKSG